jgi:hypothetical protein
VNTHSLSAKIGSMKCCMVLVMVLVLVGPALSSTAGVTNTWSISRTLFLVPLSCSPTHLSPGKWFPVTPCAQGLRNFHYSLKCRKFGGMDLGKATLTHIQSGELHKGTTAGAKLDLTTTNHCKDTRVKLLATTASSTYQPFHKTTISQQTLTTANTLAG